MNAPFKETLSNFIAKMRYLWANLVKNYFYLDRRNWKWISTASLLVILLFVAGNLLFHSGSLSLWWLFVSGLIFAAIPLLYGGMIKAGILIARGIPKHASWLVFAAGAMFFIYFSGSIQGLFMLLFYLLVTSIFIAGSLSNIFGLKWPGFPRRKKLLNIFILCVGISNLFVAIYFLSYPGRLQQMDPDAGLQALHLAEPLALPDPGQAGPYALSTFTYGTGDDNHRKEFGEEVDVVSGTVDGGGFLEGWERLPGRLRTAYWGFDPEHLPLNGRVWMPEGEGPFPVVLIVHGNHLDRDFSDKGYAYIGKHLASHGYLTVSVDENFLNRGLTNFNHSLEEENDARGWLLLKHLELLRKWNTDNTSVFFKKANTDQVVLVGHSRGGEAAVVAAFFNKLPYYPDDANEKFDFNFGIMGVVALAPVYGQYSPGNRPLPLSDLNYLALQGGMDADLESYMGLHQYNAIRFNTPDYHFKAGLYILNANHGQFNSSWGINDAGYPQGLLLNRRALLNANDQQLAALVCITSFVKATIGQEEGYVQLFRDYRNGRDWLPETRYISQFADNRADIIADYEEDMNLLTTSMGDQATIFFEGLAAMFEEENELHKGMLGTKTAMIGWNNTDADAPGSYSIHFAQPIDLEKHSYRAFQFDVAVVDRYPGERMNAKSFSGKGTPERPAGGIPLREVEEKPAGENETPRKNSEGKTTGTTGKTSGEEVEEEREVVAEKAAGQTPEKMDEVQPGGEDGEPSEKPIEETPEKTVEEDQQAGVEALEGNADEQVQDKAEEEQPAQEMDALAENTDKQTTKKADEEESDQAAGELEEKPAVKTPEKPMEKEPAGHAEAPEQKAEEKTPEKRPVEQPEPGQPEPGQLEAEQPAEKAGEAVEKPAVKTPEKRIEKEPAVHAGAPEQKAEEKTPEQTEVEQQELEPPKAEQPAAQGGDSSARETEDGLPDSDGSGSSWFEMGDEEPGELGFSIVLTDMEGNTAKVAISEHYPLVFPQQASLYKLKIFGMSGEPEPVPQHVEIDLDHFYTQNPAFDKTNLASIHFVFDRSADGMVSIDNIGFTNLK